MDGYCSGWMGVVRCGSVWFGMVRCGSKLRFGLDITNASGSCKGRRLLALFGVDLYCSGWIGMDRFCSEWIDFVRNGSKLRLGLDINDASGSYKG